MSDPELLGRGGRSPSKPLLVASFFSPGWRSTGGWEGSGMLSWLWSGCLLNPLSPGVEVVWGKTSLMEVGEESRP